MTLAEMEKAMTYKHQRLPPSRPNVVRDVTHLEAVELREALEAAVTAIGGDLEYPDEISIEWEDFVCGSCRLEIVKGRIAATFQLRLVRCDEHTATYSIREINK